MKKKAVRKEVFRLVPDLERNFIETLFITQDERDRVMFGFATSSDVRDILKKIYLAKKSRMMHLSSLCVIEL